MVRNKPDAPYSRSNIVDRGESFSITAKVVACVHGDRRPGDDYATILAMEFRFSPRSDRRARMASITLSFVAGDAAVEVEDITPRVIQFNRTTTQTVAEKDLNVGIKSFAVGNWSQTSTAEKPSMGLIHGYLYCRNPKSSSPNAARWSIQENQSTKAGIPECLKVGILLRRKDKSPFSMIFSIDVSLSGIAFEKELSGRNQNDDDPVVFDPNSTFGPWDGLFGLPDPDRSNLQDFWQTHLMKVEDVRFTSLAELPYELSNLPSDNNVPVIEGTAQMIEESQIRLIRQMLNEEKAMDEDMDEAMTGAVYIELWNLATTGPGASRSSGKQWMDLGNTPDEEKLSKFSWVKDDIALQDLPDMKAEEHNLGTNVIGDAGVEAQNLRVFDTTHTLCSLLVHKAKHQVSFKSFEDLGEELFDNDTIDSIADFFGMKKDYNGFRKLDFGSCEILEMGEGRDLDIYYIFQTPYYSSGFWSMFLVGRADPKDPRRARLLSGLIQSGADVELRKILNTVETTSEEFSYHPLVLPYHLYVNHYETTSKQFDGVLDKVKSVEKIIMNALDGKRKPDPQAQSQPSDFADPETIHWGLAKLSKTLHEASMEVAELARRRKFEDDLAKTLKEKISKRRSAQNRMLRNLERYDRWAKAHQLEIEGMPGRIDSLKTLQDNVVSIKLAKEGLSDSKAMKTLSVITILFLPGTFVATLFTTNVVSFQDSAAETEAYIKIVIPLTGVLIILYGLWLWKQPEWSRARKTKRDPEMGLGNVSSLYRGTFPVGGKGKQS